MTDKRYDSDKFAEVVEKTGAVAVISPRQNHKEQREYDRELYKEQNLVERLFQKLKQSRCIAIRYEKLKRDYQSLVVIKKMVRN